jgi:hypothetical protein
MTPPPTDDGQAFRSIHLDYEVRPRSRFGHVRPVHPQLNVILARGTNRYRDNLRMVAGYHDDFARIQIKAAESDRSPHWNNGWFEGIDGQSLYAFLANRNPARYWEVGSGNSTKFAAQAIADHQLRTLITSIDPHPRAEIDALCTKVLRQPLENTDTAIFEELVSGDVLLVDNSHRVFMNSDCAVFFLEILPRLARGVLVGIHDIFLPNDYPDEWRERFYSEQYMLACILLAEGNHLQVELPSQFALMQAELKRELAPIHQHPALAGMQPWGSSFWFTIA